MQNDPLVEWQRLTETYREMYDGELLELAADAADLTEQARQALGNEMRKRGLGSPETAMDARKKPQTSPEAPLPLTGRPSDTGSLLDRAGIAFGIDPGAQKLVPDTAQSAEQVAGPHEFTWKTFLCECSTAEEASQLAAALRQAGIESWIEEPGQYSRYAGYAIPGAVAPVTPRIVVAADQLDRAREIADRPIPREIVEQTRMQAPEFEPPTCPKCHAEDPVLEGVEPVNQWLCEVCGHSWTEPGEAETEAGETTAR